MITRELKMKHMIVNILFFVALIFLLYKVYYEAGWATTFLLFIAYMFFMPVSTMLQDHKKTIALQNDAIESMQKSIITLYKELQEEQGKNK